MREVLASIGVESAERAGRVVALPADASGIGAVLRLARERGLVVAPAWMAFPGLPAACLCLSVERLSDITEVLPADLMVVTGAGATVGTIEERLATDGMFWPAADGIGADETVGDILARAPGSWTRRGNLARRYTLGLEAVLADGEVVRTCSRTVKCVTWYDLKALFVGSRGTLGVICSAVLRLEPLPRRESVRAAYERDFAGLEGAATAAPAVPAAGAAGGGGATGDGGATGGSGALDILRRLKRELDPDGVLPPAEAAFPPED